MTSTSSSSSSSSSSSENVIGLVFFHRHGDRSPYYAMPNDKENNLKWKDGIGMLTPLGMAQLEKLGAAFRKRYLLGEPYKVLSSSSYEPKEYKVRATDYDRTIQSALSFLKGFFPDGTGPTDGLSNASQVVPVRTMPKELDKILLGFEDYSCDRLKQMRTEITNSEEWKHEETRHHKFYEKLATLSGYPMVELKRSTMSYVADPLLCEKAHGMKWIDGFTEEIFEQSVKLKESTIKPLFANNTEMRRLAGGNMVGQVINRFQQLLDLEAPFPLKPSNDIPDLDDGFNSNTVRISHFSGHDTTLISLLGTIGAFDGHNPKYGSTVVFELVELEKENGSFLRSTRNGGRNLFIRVYYNRGIENPFDQEPLDICGGKPLCPFDEFVDFMRPLVPTNFNRECKKKTLEKAEGSSPTTVILIVAVVFFCLALIHRFSKRQNKSNTNMPKDVQEEIPLKSTSRN